MNTIITTARTVLARINRYVLINLNPQLDHYRSGRSADVG